MFSVRDVRQEDWIEIGRLASNEVQEADHSEIESEWIANRRQSIEQRLDSVIEVDHQVKAYCALEQTDSDYGSHRAFIVLDWAEENHGLQDYAAMELDRLIQSAGCQLVWLRELEEDVRLLKFFKTKGFTLAARYPFQGLNIVVLTKAV